MTLKARVILAIGVVELFLGGLWYYLTVLAVTRGNTPDAAKVVGQTMGMAMGGLAGFGIIMFILAAKADRTKS